MCTESFWPKRPDRALKGVLEELQNIGFATLAELNTKQGAIGEWELEPVLEKFRQEIKHRPILDDNLKVRLIIERMGQRGALTPDFVRDRIHDTLANLERAIERWDGHEMWAITLQALYVAIGGIILSGFGLTLTAIASLSGF